MSSFVNTFSNCHHNVDRNRVIFTSCIRLLSTWPRCTPMIISVILIIIIGVVVLFVSKSVRIWTFPKTKRLFNQQLAASWREPTANDVTDTATTVGPLAIAVGVYSGCGWPRESIKLGPGRTSQSLLLLPLPIGSALGASPRALICLFVLFRLLL